MIVIIPTYLRVIKFTILYSWFLTYIKMLMSDGSEKERYDGDVFFSKLKAIFFQKVNLKENLLSQFVILKKKLFNCQEKFCIN